MEYMSRGDDRTGAPGTAAPRPNGRRKRIDWAARTVRLELFVVLVGSALLLAAVALFLGFSGTPTTPEAKQIDTRKYQTVFLNGGATSASMGYTTFFGDIIKLKVSEISI